MRYLLDANMLSTNILGRSAKRNDLYVLQEVVDEAFLEDEIQRVVSAGISIIDISKKHLDKLKDILAVHGGNLRLIRLYSNKGEADVAMLAYILSEKENPETLFNDEYTIVTKDTELTSVAQGYGIKCLQRI